MTRKYLDHLARYAVLLGLFAALVLTPAFRPFALGNLVVQAVLFVVVAAIPAQLTGRMSYVDIAWPWGLVAIGVQTLAYAEGYLPRTLLIAVVYLLIGLRMGLPGLAFLARHHALPFEFPRYRYQRLRWNEAGFTGETVPRQLEIGLQGLANISVLAAPALLLAANVHAPLAPLEIIGFAMWLGAWTLEWLSDHQKRRFAAQAGNRTSTCQVGLWKYSRHPNYFFQWMGWNALALASVPSLVHLLRDGDPVLGALTGVALVAASGFMYWTLVTFTGCKPSEYYSAQKRPDYAAYQRTTNMFIPGPPRLAS